MMCEQPHHDHMSYKVYPNRIETGRARRLTRFLEWDYAFKREILEHESFFLNPTTLSEQDRETLHCAGRSVSVREKPTSM